MRSHKLLISSVSVTVILLSALAFSLAAAQESGQAPVQAPERGGASPGVAADKPLGTSFTYQGQLIQDGAPVNGACDLRFTLFDADSGDGQVGSPVEKLAVTITGGLFTADLDFGSTPFAGQARWLQVEVRCSGGGGGSSYVIVGNRQALTATPYALYATRNWALTGNAGTTPAANYLGTSDDQALELKVNSLRALRIEPDATSPNLIGGSVSNTVSTASGATIGGGGFPESTCGGSEDSPCWNQVTASFGTVAGGYANTASGETAAVGGGQANTASEHFAVVSGGFDNTASGMAATVSGGGANTASSAYGVVSGGYNNTASGVAATVSGGTANSASGAYSFAAGYRAKATHQGSFVWADSTMADFTSAANDAFAVRASGGMTMVVGAGGWRIQPNATSPNLIGGSISNTVSAGVAGGAIAGGGKATSTCGPSSAPCWNRVQYDYAAVGGGIANTASTYAATVGGGDYNTASGYAATVAGGNRNTANAYYATVGGGYNNAASQGATVSGGSTNAAGGNGSAIGGGEHNIASSAYSVVSGGYNNTASGLGATVSGGMANTAGGDYSFAAGRQAKATHQGSFVWADSTMTDFTSAANDAFAVRASGGVTMIVGAGAWRVQPNASGPNLIGGSISNTVSTGVAGATIAGGGSNTSTCGSGSDPCWNRVSADFGTIAGGEGNLASAWAATVGGGYSNAVSFLAATIGGGEYNTANAWAATIGGGYENAASRSFATVGGGGSNTASGDSAVVGGGEENTASGQLATIAGGASSTASGDFATVGGGLMNTASGDYSFAAGRQAKAIHQGSFVWGDSTAADVSSTADNQFMVRAGGGITMYTNISLTAGVRVLPGGGAWSSVSDRNLKENYAAVDGGALLDKLAAVPVTTWNYRSQDPSIRHIGPVAQDFYIAFGVGEDDTHISTIDADGVALAAGQALYALAQEQAGQIAALQAQNAALEARLAALEARAGGGAAPLAGRWSLLGLAAAGLAAGAVLTRRGGAR